MENVVKFVLSNKALDITVRSLTSIPVCWENRFGVSMEHARSFIAALKAHQVKGYKVCRNYSIPGKSASVHAETFLWHILEYKVISIYSMLTKLSIFEGKITRKL